MSGVRVGVGVGGGRGKGSVQDGEETFYTGGRRVEEELLNVVGVVDEEEGEELERVETGVEGGGGVEDLEQGVSRFGSLWVGWMMGERGSDGRRGW